MEREALYYVDPYLKSFDAEVIAIEERGSSYAATLDRTAFYPEGGGQPGDRGRIGEVPVLHTRKENGVVVHMLDRRLPPGRYTCRLDWDRRYDYMQQHTAQHIVSGCMARYHGIATVSVHQGEDYTTIETDQPLIDADVLLDIEDKANQSIAAGLEVSAEWCHEDQLSPGELRRAPKKSGLLRIVGIEGLDRVACGGVHLASTAEVGLIKLIATETIRGHLRTVWKMGRRAYEDYRLKHDIVTEAGSLLSSPPEQLAERLRQLAEKQQETEYRRREVQLALTRHIARDIIGTAQRKEEPDSLSLPRIITTTVAEPLVDLGDLLKLLAAESGILAAVVMPQLSPPQWGILNASGLELSAERIRSRCLEPLGAKGGGKGPIWRGVLQSAEGCEPFLQASRQLFEDLTK